MRPPPHSKNRVRAHLPNQMQVTANGGRPPPFPPLLGSSPDETSCSWKRGWDDPQAPLLSALAQDPLALIRLTSK